MTSPDSFEAVAIAFEPLTTEAGPAAPLIRLWQEWLRRPISDESRKFAHQVGRSLFDAGVGAGTITSKVGDAIEAALSRIIDAGGEPSFDTIQPIVKRIIEPANLAIEGWSALATDPVDARGRLNAQTRSLREHIRELEKLALVDELTKLFNRRHLDQTLDREIARAQRYRLAFSLIMIDVDHFKEVNDRYGHLIGDEVLRHIANILRAQARKSDILARYGGEEFVLILTETPEAGTTLVAERVRKALESEPIDIDSGTTLTITASFGCASLGPSDTPRSLLERADAALYRAKQAGRNCVSQH